MKSTRPRSLHWLFVPGLASVMALAAACGGPDAAAPTTPPAPSGTPAMTASAAPTAPAAPTGSAATPVTVPTAWSKDLTKEQQIAFMKKNITPTMGPVFQAHNATHYADFGCTTCHGPAYKDPHEFLPHLAMKDGKLTAFAEKPAVAKFMAESVTPKMATAMGLPPYDMQTHQGFGCGGCHTIDMK